MCPITDCLNPSDYYLYKCAVYRIQSTCVAAGFALAPLGTFLAEKLLPFDKYEASLINLHHIVIACDNLYSKSEKLANQENSDHHDVFLDLVTEIRLLAERNYTKSVSAHLCFTSIADQFQTSPDSCVRDLFVHYRAYLLLVIEEELVRVRPAFLHRPNSLRSWRDNASSLTPLSLPFQGWLVRRFWVSFSASRPRWFAARPGLSRLGFVIGVTLFLPVQAFPILWKLSTVRQNIGVSSPSFSQCRRSHSPHCTIHKKNDEKSAASPKKQPNGASPESPPPPQPPPTS